MTQDRFRRALAALLAPVLRRLNLLAAWPATVRAQNADGTLEVQPDNPKLPALKSVPIRVGIPGAKVKVPAGARVRVGWDEGDPRKPAAMLWDDTTAVEIDLSSALIRLGSTTAGDAAALASNTESRLHALELFAAAHVHAGVTAGPTTSGVASPAPTFTAPAVASAVVKISG